MLGPILTIASYTLLEALRNRIAWVLGGLAVGAVALGGFVGQLALTESGSLQAALLAALLRVCCVLLMAGFVATSVVREAADKGQELLLALAIPRAAYVLGKLAGFGLVALLPALLFGAMALMLAPPAWCAAWAVSLWCELWIVAAFCLLCVLTLGQVMAALAATLAFYLLARAIGSLQAMAQDAAQLPRMIVDALAAVLPHLDQFTRSEWLVYGGAQLAPLLAQGAIYVTLLGAAALFDFYRKDL
ncbi:ABC transporter permease [Massilia pseudoviolaceinigra]|uniref:ABC transporter permease n=1 Tax=Massilia pseudoviolaceinigra TaxID=3057165 RepID=UPI002796B337|nr:ABC transporter permease [Massilia sp. CCM 9206]MDQ1921129.1 ABC transporter permease [Massilia sp. CCM 9206]